MSLALNMQKNLTFLGLFGHFGDKFQFFPEKVGVV